MSNVCIADRTAGVETPLAQHDVNRVVVCVIPSDPKVDNNMIWPGHF